MTFRWEKQLCRLYASNPTLDLSSLRCVIGQWLAGRNITAIIYTTTEVTVLLRGPHLRRWLASRNQPSSMMKTGFPS
jgi:hypothetical protein